LESASPPSVEAFRELAGSVTSTIPTVATPLPPAVEVATAPAGGDFDQPVGSRSLRP
jgi:hypothetical protein